MFRELTAPEEIEFRQWARDNYVPFTEIKSCWHPVVQKECGLINRLAEIQKLLNKGKTTKEILNELLNEVLS